MRLIKLWISVLALFSVTAFGLTGCGGGGGGGGGPLPGPLPTAPATPTGVSAAALNNTQVGVNWAAVTGATSYNVYWSTTSGLPKEQRTKVSVAAPPFTHSNLQSGATYFYVVTAVNSVGESAASAEVSATTTVSPTAVSATPGNAQVRVTWGPVTNASSFNLYYSTNANLSSPTKLTGVTSGTVVNALTNDIQYFFGVTAVINGVESDPSPIVSAVPSTNPAPAAPSPVQASSFVFTGAPQISLTWSPVAGAASYNVYFSTNSDVSKTNNGGSFTDLHPTPNSLGLLTFSPNVFNPAGTTYFFIITAVGANGLESTASPTLKVIPPAFTLGMVAGKTVSYTDNNGQTFVFVANVNGNLTFTSTLAGVPTSGTGTWTVNGDGSLTVLIPSGALTFNYDVFQTTNNGNLINVTFSNGSQTSAGGVTFS